MTIREYLDAAGLSARAFARKVGVDPGTMSRWLSGVSFPGGPHIEALIEQSRGKISVAGALASKRKRRVRKAA